MVSISNYAIIEHLYESPNSLVYRARHHETNQIVILKMLKEAYPSPERIAWFKREYEVTSTLHLPGVPQVYGLETEQQRWVMILEDFGGDSLSRLRLAGRISVHEFLRLAIDVATILGNIHQKHIMHKDINPSNVVFNPTTGQIKIIDFGISAVLSREQPTFRNPNVLEGTLAYMSPEQTGRMNRAMDYRTDFYSLGTTFYELITGRLPFESEDALELVHHHIARQPIPPHFHKTSIHPTISAIILKLMAKNAEDRYQTAYGLKADLEICLQYLTNEPSPDDFQTYPSASSPTLPTHAIPDFALKTPSPFSHEHSFTPGQYDISDRFLLPQKLYGREQSIQELLAAFERTSQGTNEMMLVKGVAGIGKTALVQELYKPITRRRGFVISGAFDQFQRNVPYSALIQAFRSLIMHLLTENETAITLWRQQLLETFGSTGQILIDVIPEIELIVGPQPDAPMLDAAQAQNRLNLLFQRFIQVFTKPEHPLVIFLDDMQWADGASLKLIEQVMTNSEAQHLLLIGTYRSNEVDPTHPLWHSIETLRKEGTKITTLALDTLDSVAVTRLVADTLHANDDHARPLADLIITKTGGNPFFLQEFLRSLYVEELINFNYVDGSWNWNLHDIQSRQITDNVVDLMTQKVQRLTPQSQEVVKLAACIGSRFDLIKLAVVSQQPISKTAHDLEPAIMEGLIVPLGDAYKLMTLDVPGLADAITAEYAFSHSRIQQAAYSLIPEHEQQSVHWRIGYLLLLDIPPDKQDDYIFDIVNQLNQGRAFITEREEQIDLARLNLRAACKAKASAAYAPAFSYLQTGLYLLTQDDQDDKDMLISNPATDPPWQHNYNLMLDLHNEAIEVAYLTAHFEEMEELSSSLLRHTTSVVDTVNVYLVRIRAKIAQGKHMEAMRIALAILNLLDIRFPEKPTSDDIAAGLHEVEDVLAAQQRDDLTNLPAMTDPAKLAAMRILTNTLNAAYVASPELMVMITCKMVALSLTYGYTPMSAHAYASYGLILCGTNGDIEGGYHFGQLAIHLLERFNATDLKPRTLMVVNTFIRHWKEHARGMLHPLLEAYQIGMEIGDFEFAAISIYVYSSLSLYTGKNLSKLYEEMVTHNDVLNRIKQERALAMNRLYKQVVLNLLGDTEDIRHLKGQSYDETRMIPKHEAGSDKTALFYVYFNRLMLCYLDGAYEEAIENAELADTYARSAVGSFAIGLLAFYDSLARLALIMQHQRPQSMPQRDPPPPTQELRTLIPTTRSITAHDAPPTSHTASLLPDDGSAQHARTISLSPEDEDHLDKVIANQNKLAEWATHAPVNYLHKVYLVEAEYARVIGNDKDARDYYERAMDLAREHEYINDEALTCELAARYYFDRGRPRIAQVYIQDAHYAYRTWGAQIKVNQLEGLYPQFFSQDDPVLDQRTRITTSITQTEERISSTLDIVSIIKATQAIFGEIVLEPLLTKLMHIFIENAGAQRGILLLHKAGRWVIDAEHHIDSGEMTILQCVPLEKAFIPTTIVHYVARTQDSVVLNDARQEHAFAQDLYIQSRQPQSVLCMPLAYQGDLVGILYLENNLVTGAFTASRVEVLNVLSSQAAISIVHARLYRTMEDLVQERTSALQLAQFSLDRSGDSIAWYSHDGSYLYVNDAACRAAGFEREELLAMTIMEQDPVLTIDIWRDRWNFYRSQGSVTYETRHHRRDGSSFPVEVNMTFVELDDQEYLCSFTRDISERKRTEEVLRQAKEAAEAANHAKSTFLANMSHELRTPLNAILGFTQVMIRSKDLPEGHRETIDIIHRSGEHLLGLINSVLDLSKIEAGRIMLQPTNFDLFMLLDNLEDMFQMRAATRNLSLMCERDPDLPRYICSDDVKLRQILTNLLSNAIKFTRQGHVILRANMAPHDDSADSPSECPPYCMLQFEVEDTGPGIAEDEFGTLFQAFSQTKTGIQAQEGTGLGLAISYKFVELMGGSLSVRSTVGIGTTFTVHLPVSTVDAQEVIIRHERRRVIGLEPGQPTYRLLIVDDRWESRYLLVKLLQPLGFEIQEAINGWEAVQIWDSWRPHLIWMDMRMPVMSGYEATRKIKTSSYGKETTIIALTASAFEEDREFILSTGCNDFVRKPFEEEVIFDILTRHLDVHFVYEDIEPPKVPGTHTEDTNIQQQTNICQRSQMAELPQELIERLHHAAMLGDIEMLSVIITEIEENYPALAKEMQHLINIFRFDQIAILASDVLEKPAS